MPFIFVDRRKTAKNKSAANRQAFIRRIKSSIKNSNPNNIGASVGNVGNSTGNPVRVTRERLHEPSFHYSYTTGHHDVVLIGNDQWERGDEFPISDGSGSGGKGNGSGEPGEGSENSEDDFLVEVSASEFLDIFFEDCELPNLEETAERVVPEMQPKNAGFTKEGNPSQLRVLRSYKQAMPRRKVLSQGSIDEIEKLEQEIEQYKNGTHELSGNFTDEEVGMIIVTLLERIAELQLKISKIPFFEKMDMRYAKTEKQMVKTADAVFLMIMDISGSMDEDKKRIARKFFALQYAFIKRKYPQTDLVFIAHTETAEEMSEDEFFSTRISGGTIVSSSYELAIKIIDERYDVALTNIYVSQASDGDNYYADNNKVKSLLLENGLLSKIRFMSYANVGQQYGLAYADTLKDVMNVVKKKTNKLAVVEIVRESEVYDAFRKVYQVSQPAK